VRLDLGACVADHDGVVLSFVRLRLALVAACILVLGGSGAGRAHPDLAAGHRSFGVTVDNLGRLPAVLDSLRALPRRPWVRVVFDVDPNRLADPAPYVGKVGAVRAAGDVLGELVDSSSIRRLSVTQTKARAAVYTRALGSSVSVWENGNEVNGDWTGAPAVVARKLQVAAAWCTGSAGARRSPCTRMEAAAMLRAGFPGYFAQDMVPWRRSPLWRILARAWSAAPVLHLRPDAAGARVSSPPPHAGFSYQIGGPFRPDPGVQIVDRDWHVAPALRAYSICYVNAFQAQPEDLFWWRSHHPSLLLRRDGRPVIDTGWDEQLLDTSTPAKRRLLSRIIGGWINRCAHAGYRAVEPDNLDSWTRSHGMLSAEQNLAFARLLVIRAHAAGLAVAQKNAAELAAAGRRLGFDFAVAEECQAHQECGSYLRAYGDRVIEIEYPDAGGERNFLRACHLRGGRISIVYRDRNVTPAGQPAFVERRCPTSLPAG